MSAPHPLNQAVIAQALHDLRNGQLRRCKAMGFGEEELDALKHPELVSMLVNATVGSEEHTSELQSLMRISYAVFCLKKNTKHASNGLNDKHTTINTTGNSKTTK